MIKTNKTRPKKEITENPMLCIDTPARMTLESKRKMLIGDRFMIGNKVELVSLSDKNNNIKNNNHFNKTKHRLKRSFSYTSIYSKFHCFQLTKSIFHIKDFHYLKKNNLVWKSLSSIHYKDSLGVTENSIFEMSASSSTSSTNDYPFIDPNKIHLFVKAGQDGRSQGACPFCQDVFMQLLIKAQTNKFNFDVITINLENPPKEFKELSIKPPVLIHGTSSVTRAYNEQTNAVILSDVDEIAEYLDKLYPNNELVIENPAAKKVSLNVFSKFSFFIRDVNRPSTNLELELERLDQYLKFHTDSENKFLSGKSLSGLDCSLLPKLQHIRVATENIKHFSIPYRFNHLWRYLQNAYQTDAFQKSCPPDREINWHWLRSNYSTRDLFKIQQETPYKTISIPDDLTLLS